MILNVVTLYYVKIKDVVVVVVVVVIFKLIVHPAWIPEKNIFPGS